MFEMYQEFGRKGVFSFGIVRWTIEYILSQDSTFELGQLNILGQEVQTLVNKTKVAGHYRVTWDGLSNVRTILAPGTNFCRLRTIRFYGTGGKR